MRLTFRALLLIAVLSTQACKTGYNFAYDQPVDEDLDPPPCASDVTAATENASANTNKVLDLIANLSCGDEDGVMVGQNLGSGNTISEDTNENSYESLMEGLKSTTDAFPAIAAIEYEYDRLYTRLELESANTKLLTHWDDARGLISISWMPLNPWTNDGADIEGTPGNSTQTQYTDTTNLPDLTDENSAMKTVWDDRVSHIATAIKHLQSQNSDAVILFRPFPEMNSQRFWWGAQAATSDTATSHSRFKTLWRALFNAFKEQDITNILWVYSPVSTEPESVDKTVDWAYPGNSYVDIVAGIERNDSLTITDYEALVKLERPIAMGEYGPTPAEDGGELSKSKTFDNTEYINTLKTKYPYVAYWVSWHNYQVSGKDKSFQSILQQTNATELMNDEETLTAEKLIDEGFDI